MKQGSHARRSCLTGLITILLVTSCAIAGEPFHFQYDIAPRLARAGCATAECHGGATGRGGFKLSLFATNPKSDYQALVQDLDGRRIDFLNPDQSLFLLKPTRQMKHKGGRVIELDGPDYSTLVDWIRAAAPFSSGDSGSLVELELSLAEQQLSVQATFILADGSRRKRDVTDLARFESSDDRIAAVSENGRITTGHPGETWLIARYGGLAARTPLLRPFEGQRVTGSADLPSENPIDRVWQARLAQLNLNPAPVAAPHQLLRRLYLNLVGRPPSPNEIQAFFAKPAGTRIAQTSALLLESAEFAGHFSRTLQTWFEVPGQEEDLKHTGARNRHLRASLTEFAESDSGIDDFARAIIVEPVGRDFTQRFPDPRDRAEFAARTLLGIDLSCARCHNHPLDRWSQAQYLHFAAFFTDLRPQRGADGADGAGTDTVMVPGKLFLPGTGVPVAPRLLPIGTRNQPGEPGDGKSRRAQLAQFFTKDADEALARNIANRVFGMMFAKHLIEAPGEHRLSNPAIHEPLMDLIAAQLRTDNFRVRPLLQLIATSRMYAVDSRPPEAAVPGGDPQLQFIARREAIAMSGEQFRRALKAVLGVELSDMEPPDTPLTQQLHILNSGVVQQALRTPGNQVEAIFDFETDPRAQLEQLFLLILTRPPNAEEQHEFLPLLKNQTDARDSARDLAFALIASREFGSIR